MEQLLVEQFDAMNVIHRTLGNIKKLGRDNYTVAKLKSRMELLKENYRRCQQNHWRLQSFANTPAAKTESYFKDDLFLTCEENFDLTMDYIAEGISALTPKTSIPIPQATITHPEATSKSCQLPRINLPTFAGDCNDWESFRDRFQALILSEPSLTDVSRMHYLCSCLKGEAHNVIRHLVITESNFKIAWNLIKSRYDNHRHLINLHLHSLLALPQATAETAHDLRNLRDNTNNALQALKNLERPVESWDDIVVYLVANKLDKASRKAWELKLGNSVEYPNYDELDKFIESRVRALETIEQGPRIIKGVESNDKTRRSRTVQSHTTTTKSYNCPLCQTDHALNSCSKFNEKTPAQRFEFVKSQKRCLNCLSAKHKVSTCSSQYSCQRCKRKHHTLLHFDDKLNTSKDELTEPEATTSNNFENVSSHVISKAFFSKSDILLATAWIRVSSSSGHSRVARALLDQGSVATVMTTKLTQQLKANKIRVAVSISGIGNTETNAQYATNINIAPVSGVGPTFSTTALIARTLTQYTPQRAPSKPLENHIRGLPLADRDPSSSHPIDIIIGADLYGFLLLDGVHRGSLNEPIAQKTVFGWILSGPTGYNTAAKTQSLHVHHCVVADTIDKEIRRFWEIDELPCKTYLTEEEQLCENHFKCTHSRDSSGRYIVRLPFKRNPPINIGESRSIAKNMLFQLEKRMQDKPDHYAEYQSFLKEYEELGHMTKVSSDSRKDTTIVFLPHHAVIRNHSQTTRLRVVFNASCPTSNGTSLNDHLMTGPKLQTDLPSIILRWRQYRYVLTADITKMYRQILIDSRDAGYQHIFWRQSLSNPVEEYQLRTLTYGTTPAPYLALRVLQQLGIDEGASYPLASSVLRDHIYVDDCVFGADDMETAIETRDQLIALFNKGSFPLRKWASNCPILLNDLNLAEHGLNSDKSLKVDDSLQILGVTWNPETDAFRFNIIASESPICTKRAILSTTAKFFDPLGWVTPVIIIAKIIMQQLWKQKHCDWDSPIPSSLRETWINYYTQLPALQSLSIPRWTKHIQTESIYELHGFADASTMAYAAVVYLRIVTGSNSVVISLLTAKSKVAPLKMLTVPRLELSAALLLSRLLNFVIEALKMSKPTCYCWTDSTITLNWLRQPPSHWKTFVANRVAEIQTQIPHAIWRHVPTRDNPAD